MDFLQLNIGDRIQELQLSDEEFRFCISRLRKDLKGTNQEKTLDAYLLAFFSILNSHCVSNTEGYAFATECGSFRSMIREICNNPDYASEHPLFPTVKSFIEKNPYPHEEGYVQYYFSRLSVPFADYALRSYEKECLERIADLGEEGDLQTAEAALVKCISPSDFEELQTVLARRFFQTAPAGILMQVLAEECAMAYLYAPEEGPIVLHGELFD